MYANAIEFIKEFSWISVRSGNPFLISMDYTTEPIYTEEMIWSGIQTALGYLFQIFTSPKALPWTIGIIIFIILAQIVKYKKR